LTRVGNIATASYEIRQSTYWLQTESSNRFKSFAEVRKEIDARAYVDGKEYYKALSIALKRAKVSAFSLLIPFLQLTTQINREKYLLRDGV